MSVPESPRKRANGGAGPAPPPADAPPPHVVSYWPRPRRNWIVRLLLIGLIVSLLSNVGMYSAYREYFSGESRPSERFHSGNRAARQKIALIEINGTIMPPFTERVLRAIRRAEEDDAVKGVVLSVDSPGGLVADSHQIYHQLQKLSRKKPVYVTMGRMAASGGYYVAMGAGPEGRIFAEPTTWTGSIGVIIPRYDASKLAEKIGVAAAPLKTGEFKDALSPFREMTVDERAVWEELMNESFDRFVTVIAENRPDLELADVKRLATGQIYTASQAHESGMVDEIGFEEDAIAAMASKLGLDRHRVVRYRHPAGLLEVLTGTMSAQQPENQWQVLLEATVPRAMYYCSWAPLVPGTF